MKISYERLNQIIEEEVSRFKRINEQGDTTLPAKISLDSTRFNKAVVSLRDSAKDQPALDKLAGQLEQMVVAQPKIK